MGDCRHRGVLEELVDQPADRTRLNQNREDDSFWLAPLEDGWLRGGQRAGVSGRVNLASYLRLLD